jgi:hypothetical protein
MSKQAGLPDMCTKTHSESGFVIKWVRGLNLKQKQNNCSSLWGCDSVQSKVQQQKGHITDRLGTYCSSALHRGCTALLSPQTMEDTAYFSTVKLLGILQFNRNERIFWHIFNLHLPYYQELHYYFPPHFFTYSVSLSLWDRVLLCCSGWSQTCRLKGSSHLNLSRT